MGDPSAHSVWGASSSKRLMACPGSFKLSQGLSGGRRASIYAAEGTVAHELCEKCLETGTAPRDYLHTEHECEGFTIKVDHEMVEAIEVYVDFVNRLKADGYEVQLEQRVTINPLFAPGKPPVDLFGTADCVAINPDTRSVVMGDFKYGRGVPVEVEDNSQVLYYATGVLLYLQKLGRVSPREITLVIVQPRAPHKNGTVRAATYDVLDVLEWAHDVLKPAIEASVSGANTSLNPGDHCRFCPAISVCPAIFQQAQVAAKTAFGPVTVPAPDRNPNIPPEPFELTDAELGDLLQKAEIFEAWIKAMREETYARLADGKPVPGFKLVRKRATRKWENEDAVADALNRAGEPREVWSETKVLSPAKLEKVFGKDFYNDHLSEHVVAPDTGVTLASEADPRPALPGRLTPGDVFDTSS